MYASRLLAIVALGASGPRLPAHKPALRCRKYGTTEGTAIVAANCIALVTWCEERVDRDGSKER